MDTGKDGALTIPLHAEDLAIMRNTVPTGHVRVSVRNVTEQAAVDEVLRRSSVVIDRVQIGQYVDAMPVIRDVDGVTIIPVVEEVLVVERRLLLKEEVHVRRVETTHRHQETVTVRREEVVVERYPVAE